MSKPSKAQAFLQNMNRPAPDAAPASVAESRPARPPRKTASSTKPAGREGLKHLGGYAIDETAERWALLRHRLGLDNSELLKLMVDDLYNKEKAKRAFSG